MVIVLHYPDDLFHPDFTEYRDRVSDLFTWFHLLTYDIDPKDAEIILNLECA